MWLYVSLPKYTVALNLRTTVTGRYIVCEAPPIARWTVDRPANYIEQYFLRRGATVRLIDD